MRRTLAYLLLVVSSWARAQAPLPIGQRPTGGTGSDYGNDLIRTSSGDLVLAGFSDSNDFDVPPTSGQPNLQHGWAMRVGLSGSVQWSFIDDMPGESQLDGVAEGIDGALLFVGIESMDPTSALAIKLDADGNVLWRNVYGGSGNDRFHSAVATDDGGFLVVGGSNSNDGDVSGNHGDGDAWVVKLDADGDIAWQACFGGSAGDAAQRVKRADDGYWIIGTSLSADGDVPANNGDKDVWVLQLDMTGSLLQSHTYGGPLTDYGFDLELHSDGGVILAGSVYDADVLPYGMAWVARIDLSGDVVWENHWDRELRASGIALLSGGRFAVSGAAFCQDDLQQCPQTHWDYYDASITVFDADGDETGHIFLGGSYEDYGIRLASIGNDEVVMLGWTGSANGDVNGYHGGTTGQDGYDSWLVRALTKYPRVQGKAFIDINANQAQDGGEPGLANQMVQATGGARTFTGADGAYELRLSAPGQQWITMKPVALFSAVPDEHLVDLPDMSALETEKDFPYQATSIINDLRVRLTLLNAHNPGFESHYAITCANNGTNGPSPTVALQLPPGQSFVQATPPPTTIAGNTITWQLPVLPPFAEANIVLSAMNDAGLILGEMLTTTSSIEPLVDDARPSNNTSSCTHLIVASFDPNDVLVNRSIVPFEEFPDPDYMEYTIRFQNTGTVQAQFVRIFNEPPVNADMSTFEFLEASHPVQLHYHAHTARIEFRFDPISLPEAGSDEPGSHGFVRYRIKPLNNLVLGDSLLTHAAIYFDYNAPIYTNTAVSVVETTLSQGGPNEPPASWLSPNPTNGLLRIHGMLHSDSRYRIFSTVGSLVLEGILTSPWLDISTLKHGAYVLQIRNPAGLVTNARVVKQ